MSFQIGDLIITKDYRNHRQAAYIIGVHEPGEDKDGFHYWTSPSITIQYCKDHWTRLPIKTIQARLCDPFKPARWYHFPICR